MAKERASLPSNKPPLITFCLKDGRFLVADAMFASMPIVIIVDQILQAAISMALTVTECGSANQNALPGKYLYFTFFLLIRIAQYETFSLTFESIQSTLELSK